jgi:hypothetical protein
MNGMKTCSAVAAAAFVLISIAATLAADHAGPLVLPSSSLERTGEVPVVYHLGRGFTGRATLHIHWTDSLGRVVEDKTVTADLLDETAITFHIDMSRAVAMKNHLSVDLSLDGKGINGAAFRRDETAEADFVARPRYDGWKDYVIIMWEQYPANLIPALAKLGIDGGEYSAHNTTPPDFLIDNNMRWYAESLATDYYAAYHLWREDRPKNWSFVEAKKLYQEDPNSLEAFKRHPSFWDPAWRKEIHDRGVASGERYAPYRPYFYSLSDESGIAELEAAWDFDFSDESLLPMRRWLQTQYGSLGALNQEWGTNFTAWNLVMPLTTNQAMKNPGDNFAAWADFKEWMDISYADALKMGADAIREGDPQAYVAIGGGQMPGWGGYDYARITKAITAIEPYDIGHSVDVVHSLNPSMPIVTTRFRSGPWEKHRVWYELLHGNSGLIIWDQGFEDQRGGQGGRTREAPYVQGDGQPSASGKEFGEYYNELRDGEGALIINSRLLNNRIAIHYSQPSMRTQWMLERRPDGDAWMSRGAGYERQHNNFVRHRVSWCELIGDEGLQYNFVSYDQIPQGELLKRGYPVLILPESSSLSPAEANAIREFVAQGGAIITDALPGTYDEHSRKLPQSSLEDLFRGSNSEQVNVHSFGQGKAILLDVDVLDYVQRRQEGQEGPIHQLIENLLRSLGVHPPFTVEDAAGHSVVGIDTHVFANGGVRIVALQSNPPINGDELGPPNFQYHERFEKPTNVHLRLPNSMYVYDTRARKALGQHKDLALTVDPYNPTILVTSDTPLPEMQVSVPDHAQRGSIVNIAVHAAPTPAEVSIFHIGVLDPQGNRVLYYSDNLIAKQGGGVKSIPLAANDAPGKWTITVQDMLTGQTVTRNLNVE